MSVNLDCSSAPQPEHGVVEFVPADFRALFPQFVDPPYTDGILDMYFALATLILSNACDSLVSDAKQRERLLNLLVAHIATITPISGAPSPGIVGPVSHAQEGSVSVSSGFAAQVARNVGWYAQTQFGLTFWQLTAPYRSLRYIAPSTSGVGAFAGRRGY